MKVGVDSDDVIHGSDTDDKLIMVEGLTIATFFHSLGPISSSKL